ncbi:MAG TPA: glycerate kinase [Candidatus Aquabacterium excrementipullorum]|nr:glycerate kinase [Candidatus Aquabacterium excrementipullorum]
MPALPQDPRALLRALYDTAVAQAQPALALPPHLPPPPTGRTVVIGAGKASAAMARALQACWPGDAPLGGVVITRRGHVPPLPDGAAPDRITLLQAAHPVPDEAGLQATQRLVAALQGLSPDDLVIALMSGGGSALLSAPLPGWSLAGEQDLNRQLLRCGASITEMNTVRRHLSALKGGRLAALCRPARLLTLAISDVPGDALHDIASGPTVPDPSTCADALAVVQRYRLDLPAALWQGLRDGRLETPKPDEAAFAPDEARLIATPLAMLQAAADHARSLGLAAHVLSDRIEGEARDAGTVHAGLALHAVRQRGSGASPFEPPCVLLSGGEATVTLRADDAQAVLGDLQPSGGRCSEFLLGAALALRGEAGVWMLAADTDGIDGASEAAGALIGPDTLERARALGMDPHEALRAHASGRFFARLGDAVVPGPTFTNVNDFRAVLLL